MAAKIPGQASLNPITTAFASSVSSPTAGAYYAVPPLGKPPREGAPEYEETLESFTGVSEGVGVKRTGPPMRKIFFEIIILGATKSACETTKNTIVDAASALARYDVQVDGGTNRPGCKLIRGSGQITNWFTLGDKIAAFLEISFIQLSTTN